MEFGGRGAPFPTASPAPAGQPHTPPPRALLGRVIRLEFPSGYPYRLGEPVYRIKSCTGTHTTNVAFGWPDRKTLYITEAQSGTILKAELDIPGKLMYSHA